MINGLDYSKMVKETPETVVKKLVERYDTMSDNELAIFIRDNYKAILSSVFTDDDYSTPSVIGKYVFTSRFITLLSGILQLEEYIDSAVMNQLMRVINYIFYEMPENIRDYVDINDPRNLACFSLINSLYSELSSKLIAIKGVGEKEAAYFIFGKYLYPNDETLAVEMVTDQMVAVLRNVTEQTMVDIYLTLFDRVLPIFTGVLLLYEKHAMELDYTPIYIPEKIAKNNIRLVSSAALTIMNELPIADIKRGLVIFNDDRKMLYPSKLLYTPLNLLSKEKYPRIAIALDQLSKEGVYIQYK